jgi:Leucine-rich repeat (LRR) protein
MEKILNKIQEQKDTIRKINLSEQFEFFQVPEIVAQCPNLEDLDVSFNDLTAIPGFIFALPKLKKLSYLCCRQLKEQPKHLSTAVNLEKLKIHIGKGQTVPSDIDRLPALKSLTLSGELTEIPPVIFNLSGLEELHLFDTDIATLPPEIAKLKKLKTISFWQATWAYSEKPVNLRLKEIFQNLAPCENLKALLIDSNKIRTIPQNVALLKNLRIFSAKNNMLSEYPTALHSLTKLKELDLSVNRLKEIPPGIGTLRNLKILKLNSNWKNKLNTQHLFKEIHHLENLEELILYSCQAIKSIPKTIGQLSRLKILDVDNNLLRDLPPELASMKHLRELRIGSNKIPTSVIEKLRKSLPKTRIDD